MIWLSKTLFTAGDALSGADLYTITMLTNEQEINLIRCYDLFW